MLTLADQSLDLRAESRSQVSLFLQRPCFRDELGEVVLPNNLNPDRIARD